jgi:hypothetical protein
LKNHATRDSSGIIHKCSCYYKANRAEDKLLMRFPNEKMVEERSYFKTLTVRSEAKIKIEAWTVAVGSKGELQEGWFRVKQIPADQ